MNILFLTIGLPNMNQGGGLYADLIHELIHKGHNVTAISPTLPNQKTGLYNEGGMNVLRVELLPFVGNFPTYKKILGVITMNPRYKRAYRKYLKNMSFDWIIMPTPPSSLIDVVLPIKKHTNAKFYIVLRDIHPESKKRIPTSETMARTDVYDECKKPYTVSKIMYNYLYKKSQKGYKEADIVGCMSPANMSFVKSIAPYLKKEQVTLLPNWYRESTSPKPFVPKEDILKKYGLEGKFIAIFGGTVGEGQAIWNIASLAKKFKSYEDIVFLIVGRGVKMPILKKMAEDDNLTNMRFVDFMPREEYESLLAVADLGLITIDEKFPVPTSPSKVIGYMALHQPVLAMVNKTNDYGEFYLDSAGCGLWSADLDNEKMYSNFLWFYEHPEERKQMGEAGYKYFKEHFTVEIVCDELCKQLKNE